MQYAQILRMAAMAGLLTVVGTGCGKRGDDASSETNRAKGGGGPVELKQSYAAGEYEMEMSQSIEQDISFGGGNKKKTSSDQEFTIRLHVPQPDEQGRRVVSLDYTRARQSMKIDGDTISYDSATPPGPQAALPEQSIHQVMQPLLDAEIKLTMAEDGEPLEVTGLDEVWDSMARNSPHLAQLAGTMKKQLGNDAIRKLWEMQSLMLPEGPVKLGDVWRIKESLEMPVIGVADLDYTCTLTEVDRDAKPAVAVVAFDGTLTAEGSRPGPIAGSELRSVRFKQKGEYKYDLDRSMVTRQQLSQEGTLDMTANGRDIQADQEMTQTLVTSPR